MVEHQEKYGLPRWTFVAYSDIRYHWYTYRVLTRSLTEVAHFRYFVSERWASMTQNRRNVTLHLREKNVL